MIARKQLEKEERMKARAWMLIVSLVVVLGAPAIAEEAKPAKAKPAAVAASLTTIPAADMKWETDPADPAVKVAVVWGDMNKGAHGAFHKFPAGWTSPLHTHSADVKLVVISGTLIQGTEDGKETKLGPGSYVQQPHTVKHVTKCDVGAECVVLGIASGKFDMIPATTSAPKA